jgi:hypothetical protein
VKKRGSTKARYGKRSSPRSSRCVPVVDPLIAHLQAEIVWLRGELEQARASLTAVTSERAHAMVEYYRQLATESAAAAETPARPSPRKGKRLEETTASREAVPWAGHLMADGHLDGPVHTDEEEDAEQEIMRREAALDAELEGVKQ